MTPGYQSGEEIREGDRVSYAGNAGVKFIVERITGLPGPDWFFEDQRCDGPTGSVESGFLRVDSTPVQGACCPYSGVIEQFVSERRKLSTPGDPSAVRKNDCSDGITLISR
jgi:hypothetical protein